MSLQLKERGLNKRNVNKSYRLTCLPKKATSSHHVTFGVRSLPGNKGSLINIFLQSIRSNICIRLRI